MNRGNTASVSSDEKDPERILKLKECCDLLLAGGYFRARIATLSPFDKVVGGLVWSITASGADVDVDVIFQENASIGQKIKTSDQIVRAMVSMKCPYPLQSHQIQGLDYAHLFPVIQWLVRKVIETRRLTGDTIRSLSISQFSKNYKLPEDERSEQSRNYIGKVLETYRPTRKFKQKSGANFESVEARTEATLLEYGEKIQRAVTEDEEKEEKKRAQAAAGGPKSAAFSKFDPTKSSAALEAKAKEEEAQKKAAAEKEAARLASMQQQLSSYTESSTIAGKSVGALVSSQAEELAKAAAEYEEMKKRQEELDAESATLAGSKRGAEMAFQRQLEGLKKRLEEAETIYKQKKIKYQEHQTKMEELKNALAKRSAYIERIHRESEKLSAIESNSTNAALLDKLKHLVGLNEQLKSQEIAFKQSCIQQRENITQQIKSLDDNSTSAAQDEETRRMKEIERLYESDLTKLNKIRRVLAKKNQDLAKLNRLIDEVPTRAELLQYERRFVELYSLVAEKLSETKKYYALYNTLNDSYSFMQSEDKLLNSIIQQYPAAMKTKPSKEAFVESMNGILKGIEGQANAKREQLEKEKKVRDDILFKYGVLMEKQRNYFRLVKEFQEECFKNEKLLEAVENPTANGTEE